MERKYAVTLKFNPNIPYNVDSAFEDYSLFVPKFKDYLLSLDLFNPDPKETVIGGSHIFTQTRDGGDIDIAHLGFGSMLYSISVQSTR